MFRLGSLDIWIFKGSPLFSPQSRGLTDSITPMKYSETLLCVHF